jgi:hypothetical protein
MKEGVNMKISFNKVKIIFIVLYLLLVSSILFLSPLFELRDIGLYIMILIYTVTLVLVFLPIKYTKIGYYKYKKSKFIPLIIFSLMLAVLFFSVNATLGEFFGGGYHDLMSTLFNDFYLYIVPLIIWIIFAVIGIIINLKKDEDNIYKKYLVAVLSGSLLELIITIPLHILIIKRGECLVGLLSMLGILGGFLVLMFVMGPAIFLFLIFFYKKYNKKKI